MNRISNSGAKLFLDAIFLICYFKIYFHTFGSKFAMRKKKKKRTFPINLI